MAETLMDQFRRRSGSALPTRDPAEIRVGRRHRQNLGDLAPLAASIAARGLIAPIAVNSAGELVAGARRLVAWRMAFGPDAKIPTVLVEMDPLAGEYDENVHRKPLAPSELVALMRELTPAIAAASRERQIRLGRTHGKADPCDSISHKGPAGARRGRTRELVAGLLGVSRQKLSRAAEVVDAAAADPERFGRHLAQMDRTGKVDGPWRRVVVARMADGIRAEPPPLPSRGPYRVIVADVPWPQDHDAADQSERATAPYPRMTYGEIEAFGERVRAIAHDDVALWFWTTNHHIGAAYTRILPAWGFAPKTVLTWGKADDGIAHIGRGLYLREQTEHAILAVRGSPTITLSAESTLLLAPRRAHSEKPAAFYDLVERVCPAPRYACLFSHLQAPRPSWDQHSSAPPAAETAAVAPVSRTRRGRAREAVA